MSRRFHLSAALGVCAFTLAGACSDNIEYSILAAPETASPTLPTETTPTVTLESAPSATPNVDPKAQIALKQMRAAYANLKSFSCDVKLRGSADVPKVDAQIRWQKPNRFAVSMNVTLDRTEKMQTVSDGKNLFRTSSSRPKEYLKVALPTGFKTLTQALATSNTSAIILSGLDEMLAAQETTLPQTLTLRDGADGTRIITRSDRTTGENASEMATSTDITFTVGADNLLRAVTVRFVRGDKIIEGTETYSNVRINPVFPAATFAFVPQKGAKLFVPPSQPLSYDARLKPGALPIAFQTTATNGQTVSLAQYKGKVLLLDFWATWCGPCVAELPDVQAVYAKYHSKGFEILGVSLDEDRESLRAFVKERKMTWPQIFDGKGWKNEIAQKYGVQAIPFTVLVGRDGKIAAVDVRGEGLEKAVQNALAKK